MILSIDKKNITKDIYDSFTIDASQALDPEIENNKNFTYFWTCLPNNKANDSCANNTDSYLTVTSGIREKMKINSPGSYQYSVKIMSGVKESELVLINVTLTNLIDYANDCVQLNDFIDYNPLSYDMSQNGRNLYFDLNQDF